MPPNFGWGAKTVRKGEVVMRNNHDTASKYYGDVEERLQRASPNSQIIIGDACDVTLPEQAKEIFMRRVSNNYLGYHRYADLIRNTLDKLEVGGLLVICDSFYGAEDSLEPCIQAVRAAGYDHVWILQEDKTREAGSPSRQLLNSTYGRPSSSNPFSESFFTYIVAQKP
ncbi:MAG TPA: hypothetical protein VMR45_02910 [Patescibacteria group bacterium]|nr:hypothetical protein [Patescibacteria group bacterium]